MFQWSHFSVLFFFVFILIFIGALAICSASDTDESRELLMAGRSHLSIQEFASAIPNHLLLGSLLEHLCFVYESNPARSRMLFKGTHPAMTSILKAVGPFFLTVCEPFSQSKNDLAEWSSFLTVIGQRLAAMNLLSPLAVSDEFSTVRLQHNRAFTELLHAASDSLYPQVCMNVSWASATHVIEISTWSMACLRSYGSWWQMQW